MSGFRRRWIALKRLLWTTFVRLWPSASDATPVHVRQLSVNGYRMLAPTNEAVGRALRLFGAYEPDETTYLGTVIASNDICVDVGANVGYFTLLMASRATQGFVHAFEPVPRNFHLLSVSVALNSYTNVVVNRMALGADETERELCVTLDSGYSSFLDTGRQPVAEHMVVPVTTLDAYVARVGVARVDVLKIDVEGAEKEVLCGARALLTDVARRPRLILLELYEPMLVRYGTSISDIVAGLVAVGYEPFVLHGDSCLPYTSDGHLRQYNVCFAVNRRDVASFSPAPPSFL